MPHSNTFTGLLYAQATEKDSLRAIETGLRVQNKSWSSLGLTSVARNTLAHANEKRPWNIFESLFYSLLKKCQKDEEIEFLNDKAREAYPGRLRLVTFYDTVHDKTYEFLTDEFRLSALNIALIYKQRWQVELFFKWIKQHLKIKTFVGTSKNAVMTQIWVAMIYFLLLAFIKFQTKFAGSLLDLSRMIAEVILQKVHLVDLLSLTPKTLRRLRCHDSLQIQLF